MPGGMPGMPGMSSRPVTQLVFKRPVRPKSAGMGSSMFGGSPGGSMSGDPRRPRRGSGDAGGMMMPGGMPDGMGGMGDMSGMPGGTIPPAQPAGGFQVIGLRHASANDMATTLKALFANIQAVPDVRTNALILKADAATLKEVKELIQKLDVAGPAPPQDPTLPGLPGSGAPGLPPRR